MFKCKLFRRQEGAPTETESKSVVYKWGQTSRRTTLGPISLVRELQELMSTTQLWGIDETKWVVWMSRYLSSGGKT